MRNLSTGADCEDPDLAQAVRDFLELGAEIRRRSAIAIKLAAGSPQREAEEHYVRELVSQIEARADRIGHSSETLILAINAELDVRDDRRRRRASSPAGKLIAEVERAETAVRSATAEYRAAQARLQASQAQLRAAEAAYRAYGGAPLTRKAA